MIEVLEFIFQSFWHWLGTLLLLGALSGIFRTPIYISRPKDKENKNEKQ